MHLSSSELVLSQYLKVFFITRGISEAHEQRILPYYVKALSKYDNSVLYEVLEFMADTWCDPHNRVPTVADIVEQYNRLKARAIRLRDKKNRQTEQIATKKVSGFWEAYKQCREAGIKDVGVIAKYLQQNSGGSTLPEKKCSNNHCDRKLIC